MNREPFQNRIAALAVMAFLTLSSGSTQSALAADLDARIEAHRKQGLPLNLEELNKWHGYPIKGPNAAHAYIEAIDLFSKQKPDETPFRFLLRRVELPRSAPLPTELRQTINDFVRLNQSALKRLHEAALVKECRFPTDWRTGWNTYTMHRIGPVSGSKILNLEALKRAEDGEIEGALDSVEAAIAAANALSSETELAPQLARMLQLEESYLVLERILNRTKPTVALLDRIGKIPSVSKDIENLKRGFIGELCMGLAFFKLSAAEKAAGGSDKKPTFLEVAAFKLAKSAEHWRQDRRLLTEVMLDSIDALELPNPERLERGKEIADRLHRIVPVEKYIGTALAHPSPHIIFGRQARHEALVRMLKTVVAIERSRLKNNGIEDPPDSLDELAPNYLDSIPMDPFDGAPLRYLRLPKGYMIYSIERNLTDDGGTKPGDRAFIIER